MNIIPHSQLTETILGSCFEVMNTLGVGFLETVYKNALTVILKEKGISVKQEVPFVVLFHGECIGRYVADLVVEETVIIELKCCHALAPGYQAQVINYLCASHLPVGLLVNFGKYRLEYKRLHNSNVHAFPLHQTEVY